MRLYVQTFGILLFMCMTAPAAKLDFVGDIPDDSRAIERRISLYRQTGADSSALADSVVAWLTAEGYIYASANWLNGTLSVFAGEQYRLCSVYSADNRSDSVNLNVPFTPEAIDSAVDSLLHTFYNKGHYFARANIQRIDRSGTDVKIMIKIEPGPVVHAAEKRYTGAMRSQRRLLDRYIPFMTGDLLTTDLIYQAEAGAKSIPFMEFTPPLLIRPRPGFTEADIEFRLVEKRAFRIVGGGGYIPQDGGSAVWSIDSRLINPFGSGRRLSLLTERHEKGRNNLRIAYTQPLFVLGQGELHLEAATRDYRDDFSEFRLRTAYDFSLRQGISARLDLSWARVETAGIEPGYSRYQAGFHFRHSSMADSLNPARGFAVDASIAFAYRRYFSQSLGSQNSGAIFTETRNRLDVRHYQPLAGSFVLVLRLSWQGYETDEPLPPLSELFLLGGQGSIRGYRNQKFPAQRAALGSVEPRIRFSSGFLFLFYDAAYLNRPIEDNAGGTISDDELFRDSYGLGVRLIARRRAITLSLGWPRDADFSQPRLSIEFSSDL